MIILRSKFHDHDLRNTIEQQIKKQSYIVPLFDAPMEILYSL